MIDTLDGLSIDEDIPEVDIFGDVIQKHNWDIGSWSVGSVSVPCTFCDSERNCTFEYDGDPSHVKNIFTSICSNFRCTRKRMRTTLQDLYCARKYCKTNKSNMKCSYMMDGDGKIWNCCTCTGCDRSIVGPYTCIHESCHYPLILCDARPFSQDSLAIHLSYGCAICFSNPKKRYKISVHTIQCHDKDIIFDPTLARDHTMSCPKCLIVGAVISMEGEDCRDGLDNNLFSFKFYCINPKCHCYWKIEHL